jgi:hypothetical protein
MVEPPNALPLGQRIVAINMSKKKASTKDMPEDAVPEKSEEEPSLIPSPEEDIDEVEEEPIEEEKPSQTKSSKKRAKLSVLQAAVYESIRERPQRPRAIQTIIRGTGGVDIPRNEIIRSLNELREKGLVDKVTTKAWQAK